MDFILLNQLISEKSYSLLKSELKNALPADIADFLDSTDEKQALLVFRLLPKEIAAEVFAYLSVERQANLSELVNENEFESKEGP